jgi:hypothetical protein
LPITARNRAGQTTQAKIQPGTAPKLTMVVKEVAPGVYEIEAHDQATGDPVTIDTCDGKGHIFKKGSLQPDQCKFRYTDSGQCQSASQKTTMDPRHGKLQDLIGHGDLTVTATNTAGQQTKTTVKATEAPPPKLSLESIGNDFYRIKASDNSGSPVTLRAKDSKGYEFSSLACDGTLEPNTVFQYVEAGDAPNHSDSLNHATHGQVPRWHGRGKLIVSHQPGWSNRIGYQNAHCSCKAGLETF